MDITKYDVSCPKSRVIKVMMQLEFARVGRQTNNEMNAGLFQRYRSVKSLVKSAFVIVEVEVKHKKQKVQNSTLASVLYH